MTKEEQAEDAKLREAVWYSWPGSAAYDAWLKEKGFEDDWDLLQRPLRDFL